jgi:segregation and condensation protein B
MTQPKPDEDLKNRIEAVLFSAGKKISLDDIAKHARVYDKELIKKILFELQQDYESRNSPTMVVEDGDSWKLIVREKYLSYVKKIVGETELPKSTMETMAIIAWKSPALQSEIVEIRSNKAYNHIDDLEKAGFIIKEKHGRSYLLKLSQKFFDYFDIKNEDEIKSKFERFKDRALKKMSSKQNLPAQPASQSPVRD